MPSYRDILQQIRSEIDEVDPRSTSDLLASGAPPALVDVRERDEWEEGHIPGAVHIPRGNLESRIERVVPDREQAVILYCSSGNRSLFAARTLEELGYETVSSLAGGFTEWKRNGFATALSRGLEPQQRARYSRHLLIPEVGEEGQLRLLDSRILLIGAGGLGSPAALYLAAAGVGTIGIVDDDAVDATNLQRQILHSTERLGRSKAESARETIQALNPDVEVKLYRERLTSENVDRILDEGWDVIVDGADNFPTRYLLNDASVWHGIPVVHGSIFRFEGQVTVFKPGGAARGAALQDGRALRARPSEMTSRAAEGDRGDEGAALQDGRAVRARPSEMTRRAAEGDRGDDGGPCYRCLFPQPPPPELAPSCAEGGVLGVLPGVIGSLQANEALKLALGIGEPLVGRLLLYEALEESFTEVSVRRDRECPVCGEQPTITEYIDYVEFCQGSGRRVTT